ncbi:MAG TPA: FAD-dependent oxidoreductase [Candidatus Limiplasma sp.]|nr:FAD-dependent oxidoreductase [Candidatus Limiplasma sp.]
MTNVTITKSIPVAASYDVVVCGGGPSGFIGAIAAARKGAKVALIERYGFLGGMATAGLVAPISEFCYNNELVVGGIPWEFAQRLEAEGGATIEYPLGSVCFDPERYKLLAQQMLLESGVTPYYHAYLSDCLMDNTAITHVVFESKSGTTALAGRYFLDCTGDGDLSFLGGVPMQAFSAPLQPASLCFCLGGIDATALPKIRHEKQGVNYHMESLRNVLLPLMEKGEIPRFGGPWMCWMLSKDRVLVNMTRTEGNMIDEREQTQVECRLREDAFQLVQALAENVEAFKNAKIVYTATQAGVRETRHICGAHILTGSEYASATRFPDAIGRGAHPIDIHSVSGGSQRCEFLKEAAYIPYRSIITSDITNLLVPGRSFSADREASASARVQASMMGLGQAAGFAAAQCTARNCSVQDVDVEILRKELISVGSNIS